MSEWTVLCDFDGTIGVEDTTDVLLERYGQPGWEPLEEAWRAGRIGSRECMAGQIALLDMSRAELDACLAQRRIDPGFAAFVENAQARGLHIEVVSDGLDYAIGAILSRCGLASLPVIANHLSAADERRWRLDFPHQAAGCRSGTCKCARLAAPRSLRQRVLMIGDGASDFCVAEAADFVFAKGRLIAHCAAKNIPHAPVENFADASALLPDLIGGKLVAIPAHRVAAPLPNAASV